jgi:hypothetical protein
LSPSCPSTLRSACSEDRCCTRPRHGKGKGLTLPDIKQDDPVTGAQAVEIAHGIMGDVFPNLRAEPRGLPPPAEIGIASPDGRDGCLITGAALSGRHGEGEA